MKQYQKRAGKIFDTLIEWRGFVSREEQIEFIRKELLITHQMGEIEILKKLK